MENKKALNVNAATCDVRNITEELLAAYSSVTINCALVISNERANRLLAEHNAQINAANVITLDDNLQVSLVNGAMKIAPGQIMPEKRIFLIVNGKLDIAPGSEETLKAYAGMHVNGSVTAPESLTGLLAMCNINGHTETYPDGCIRLRRKTALDRTFALRAKQDALYYAAGHIVALAGDIDFAKLAAKNVRFATKKLYVAESLAEAAIPLFDESADIEVLPDDCTFVNDDLDLDETAALSSGKYYVDGDVTLLKDGPWLDGISYLHVNGGIQVAKGLEKWLQDIGAEYDDLEIVGGVQLYNKETLLLTKALLESAERGLSIWNCDVVTVAEDVDAALLEEKLVSVKNCDGVVCTEGQAAVVERVAENVDRIGPDAGETREKEKDEDDGETVCINTAAYTF